MRKKALAAVMGFITGAVILAGCSSKADIELKNKAESIEESQKDSSEAVPEEIPGESSEEGKSGKGESKQKSLGKKNEDAAETVAETGAGAKTKDESDDKKSLAKRLAGKYSYHNSDEEGNEEFLIMEVVPFADNLYAFCGHAMPGDYSSLEAYSFWATEFVPFDATELSSTDGDSVTVNELRFSIMSNAGKYWDAGHKGTITFTDDGLLFEGFDHEGFLVPEQDDSRLFLKDERVSDTFPYLTDGKGNEELEGIWELSQKDSDLYIEFSGSNMYMYSKAPDSEVFYAAGGCEYQNGSFLCRANCIENGGMPFELNCDYEIDGDKLTLTVTSTDMPEEIPVKGDYRKVKAGDVHVTTMDEVELDSESFGYYPGSGNIEMLKDQDYYGVFVSAVKDPEKCTSTIEEMEKAGFDGSFTVYTPDFSGLNQEPYYVVTTGLYKSENDAKDVLSKVKKAGFNDAYVKYAGSYQGGRYWYTMYSGGQVELLKDSALLRGVSVMIPYSTDGEPVTGDLLVKEDAVFDKTAELQFFGNYEDGDSPYKWIVRNYNLLKDDPDKYQMNGPALSGVFEVSLEDNKVTAYYGSYWWD